MQLDPNDRGVEVQLQGLVKSPHLNGLVGKIEMSMKNHTADRLAVFIPELNKTMKVKPENLKPLNKKIWKIKKHHQTILKIHNENYPKCLALCEKVLKMNENRKNFHYYSVMRIKGCCLSSLGKSKESAEIFKTLIDEHEVKIISFWTFCSILCHIS